MRGYKDKHKKFHPIKDYKGVRKSRDQSAKTKGIRMKRIFQDDPNAIEKLEKKLEGLEKQREYWKTVKKTVPRDYSNTEGDKKWYMPQLINANIRSTKMKIEKIKERQQKNIGLERKTTFKNGKKVFYYQEVGRKARIDRDSEIRDYLESRGIINHNEVIEKHHRDYFNKQFPKHKTRKTRIVDSIKHGDKVTIVTPRGQRLTGKAVMKSSLGDNSWVLNTGGAHGTPALASDENVIKVVEGR